MVTNDDQQVGVSRRTMVKGAAWSVPVIAVAVSTPLAAASEPGPVQPQPAPGGGLSEWQGSTSVGTWTVSQPHRVQINVAQNVGFNVLDPETGDVAEAGKYTSGTVTVKIQWGAGSGVTTPTSYRIEEKNLNGWVLKGALPAEGDTGIVEYTYTGVLNGAGNIVQLPVVWLYPSSGSNLTLTYVNTTLSADFLSEKASGARVP